jgi:hypothetical protein
VAIEVGVGVDFGWLEFAWLLVSWLLQEANSVARIQIDQKSRDLFFMMHSYSKEQYTTLRPACFIRQSHEPGTIIVQAGSSPKRTG